MTDRTAPALDDDACYRALVARDARFDGAFFVGVKTTGVYCRPVCRARTPGRDRCAFFVRAALAEQAGFRACFRCRPERAPGASSVDATSRLVADAARRIEEGALNEGTVEELSASLGVGARHLRRSMKDELGVGPIELALSRRVGIARELLLGTSLPITDVAFASGFSSIRRFNAAYRAHQRMTPSEVRRPRPRDGSPSRDVLRLVLDVRPPFDPDLAFAFLRARLVHGNEAFSGGIWRKGIAVRSGAGAQALLHTGALSVRAEKGRSALVVEVSSSLAPVLMILTTRVRRAFDTDADLPRIGAVLSRDPALAPLLLRRPALRVMGALDPFEQAVRAVLGQQISVKAALAIAARLVERVGFPLTPEPERPDDPRFAFPDAQRLAECSEESLRSLGLTRARAETLRALAAAVAEGRVTLDRGTATAHARTGLLALPGIGPWTADYIALRALSAPDAFPAGDLVLRKALGGLSVAACEARSACWKPWRGYAAVHLWTGYSEELGT